MIDENKTVIYCGREDVPAPREGTCPNLEFLRASRRLYVVAMHEELDSAVTGCEVLYTGVGKARAARGLLGWIRAHRDIVGSREAPLVVNVGTAASGKYCIGDIVLCDTFCNNGDSFTRETFSFDSLPEKTGRSVGSSDFFVCEDNFYPAMVKSMRSSFDCLDMESFALADICRQHGLQFCAVKCISDGADASVESFDEALPKFRAKLNDFITKLEN